MAEVIIVDSDSKRGKYIRDIIKTKGYKTRHVKSTSAASRKMSQRWADVVFLAGSEADDTMHRPDVFRVVYPGSYSYQISTEDSRFFLNLITTLQGLATSSSGDSQVSHRPAKARGSRDLNKMQVGIFSLPFLRHSKNPSASAKHLAS